MNRLCNISIFIINLNLISVCSINIMSISTLDQLQILLINITKHKEVLSFNLVTTHQASKNLFFGYEKIPGEKSFTWFVVNGRS